MFNYKSYFLTKENLTLKYINFYFYPYLLHKKLCTFFLFNQVFCKQQNILKIFRIVKKP